MRNGINLLIFAVLCLAMPGLVACARTDDASDARIAIAANFKHAMDALEADFEARSDYELSVTTGSTGKLYAQISAGAPFDVFLSADQRTAQRLVDDGLTAPGGPFTYAVGRLVLWDPAGGEAGPLRLATVRHVALANPDLAPYGAAAAQVLGALDLPEGTPPRAIGENVGQAFAFARTGHAELGFVALSQILSLPEAERGTWWTVPQDLHDPIRQDAVLLARSMDDPAALAFFAYLQTEEAGAIISGLGYTRD